MRIFPKPPVLRHGPSEAQIGGRPIPRVDLTPVLDGLRPAGSPVALAGCRLDGTNSESCAHDLVAFDGSGGPPEMVQRGDGAAVIHHASLGETRPAVLVWFTNLQILRDGTMSLASFLEGIRRRRDDLFVSCIRDAAAESVLCSQRALQSDLVDVASCWQKCATLYLADAALLSRGRLPSSHALDGLRQAKDGTGIPALVSRSLGVERATPSLLARMCGSAAALSGMAGLMPPDVVKFKAASLQRDGRLADCYYYLCRVGRDGMFALNTSAGDRATIRYASRISLDAERDATSVRRNTMEVRAAADRILEGLAGR